MKGLMMRIAFGLLALLAYGADLQAQAPAGEGFFHVGRIAAANGLSVSNRSEPRGAFLANFGTKLVDSVTRAQLQYQNVGGGPISNIELGPITGPGSAAFSIFNDACTGQTLAPDGTCIITVDFSPPDNGTFTAEFDVISTSINSPETVGLTGEGIFDNVFSDRFETSGGG